MKKISSVFVLLLLSSATMAQKALNVISIKETERIERTLSADDMQGRRTFTPGIEKAANFIASEFEKTGLQKWNNGNTYLQSFSMVRTKALSQKILVNGVELDAKKAIIVSPAKSLMADNNAGYELVSITAKMNFPTEARKALGAKKNTIVLVDTAHANMFGRFAQMRSQLYSTQPNVIMLLVDKAPSSFSVELKQEITEMPLANVVGLIPGKSKPNEYVIFSGHYDHLGINSKKMENNDSIYNGANDDAAGTTAMIMLAKVDAFPAGSAFMRHVTELRDALKAMLAFAQPPVLDLVDGTAKKYIPRDKATIARVLRTRQADLLTIQKPDERTAVLELMVKYELDLPFPILLALAEDLKAAPSVRLQTLRLLGRKADEPQAVVRTLRSAAGEGNPSEVRIEAVGQHVARCC